MPRKEVSAVTSIKLEVINKIKALGLNITPNNELGQAVYKIDNQIILDVSYASLNSRNEYFFGIEKKIISKYL